MKIIFFMLLALMPATAQAEGKLERQIDLGGGYFIPAAPSNLTVAETRFGVNLPNGLDCGGIDWAAQMKQELSLNLSQQDIQAVGAAAVSASAAYLTAAMRPTWYAAIQNSVKSANAKISMAKTDCRSIEAELVKNDPLDLYSKKKQAANAGELTAAGATLADAVKQASNNRVEWSLSQEIGSSDMTAEGKANLAATLGEIHFRKDGGVTRTGGDRPAAVLIDHIYRLSRVEIGQAVFDRFVGNDDCSLPLFSDPDTVAADAKQTMQILSELTAATVDAPPTFSRDSALKLAMRRELSKKPDQWISCAGVQTFRAYTPEDRAELVRVISDAQTLRGLGLTLRRTRSELANLKLQKPDQADVIDRLSPLPQLQQAYADLQQEIEERGEVALVLQKIARNAEQARRDQAAERQKAQIKYRPQVSRPSFTGGR